MSTTESDATGSVSRRSFLNRSAAAGVGIALVGSLDTVFGADAAEASPDGAEGKGHPQVGYGPLMPCLSASPTASSPRPA